MQEAIANTADGPRERILEAAAAVFVEHGYRGATIREICRRAGANVASINYYFGDKQSLYRELLLGYPTRSFERRPKEEWKRPGMCGDEMLFEFVKDFLTRLMSPEKPQWHAKLMTREMVEPTEVLDQMIERFIGPQVGALAEIVRAVAGREMCMETLMRCVESVMPQIVFHVNAQQVIRRLHPERVYDEAEIQKMARHIAQFSAAGIRAVTAGEVQS